MEKNFLSRFLLVGTTCVCFSACPAFAEPTGNLFAAIERADVSGLIQEGLFMFTPDGVKSTIFDGVETTGGYIAVDGLGRTYLTSGYDKGIYRITPEGNISTFYQFYDYSVGFGGLAVLEEPVTVIPAPGAVVLASIGMALVACLRRRTIV